MSGSGEDDSGERRPRFGLGAYASLAEIAGWRWLAAATFGARLPVAMAPLTLVFAGHHATGSYAFGGVLVAAHTLGETLAAPAAGTLIDRRSPRHVLATCLAIEAALFAAAAVTLAVGGNHVLLVGLVFLAGAVPAGAPGGLRALLTPIVGRSLLPRALSADTILNQICWGLAPLLTSAAVILAPPMAAIGLIAIPAALGAIATIRIPATSTEPSHDAPQGWLPLLRKLKRTLFLTAALRLLLGALTVVAPPLFESAGTSAFAGVALASYAIGTGLGSAVYGTRERWPGSYEQQADTLLTLLGAIIAAAVFVHSSAALLVLYALAGFLEGPVVVARLLHLEKIVPADRQATGFSLQYAAIGVGFAAGGMLLAELITSVPPQTIITIAGLTVTIIGLLAVLSNATRRRLDHTTAGDGDGRRGRQYR